MIAPLQPEGGGKEKGNGRLPRSFGVPERKREKKQNRGRVKKEITIFPHLVICAHGEERSSRSARVFSASTAKRGGGRRKGRGTTVFRFEEADDLVGEGEGKKSREKAPMPTRSANRQGWERKKKGGREEKKKRPGPVVSSSPCRVARGEGKVGGKEDSIPTPPLSSSAHPSEERERESCRRKPVFSLSPRHYPRGGKGGLKAGEEPLVFPLSGRKLKTEKERPFFLSILISLRKKGKLGGKGG